MYTWLRGYHNMNLEQKIKNLCEENEIAQSWQGVSPWQTQEQHKCCSSTITILCVHADPYEQNKQTNKQTNKHAETEISNKESEEFTAL